MGKWNQKTGRLVDNLKLMYVMFYFVCFGEKGNEFLNNSIAGPSVFYDNRVS